MVELVDRQICFRLADAVPAAFPVGPFRLRDAAAEALSELLQVFACGEESAAHAFAHLGSSPLEEAARRALARVADEELIHERLLRGLRSELPAPAPDRSCAAPFCVSIMALRKPISGCTLLRLPPLIPRFAGSSPRCSGPTALLLESRPSPWSCVASSATRPGMSGYRVVSRPRWFAGMRSAPSLKMPDWVSSASSRGAVLHLKAWA
jgi:hypothetical protein